MSLLPFSDSTKPDWFRIDPSSGVIEVNAPLDREELLEENEEVWVLVTVSKRSTPPLHHHFSASDV